jgi:hypothetical protein
MRAVAGVRVQDELGVGKELLQDVGVDRRDHDVVGAVADEDGKPEALEVGVAGVLGDLTGDEGDTDIPSRGVIGMPRGAASVACSSGPVFMGRPPGGPCLRC